jgi:hypothetical protein
MGFAIGDNATIDMLALLNRRFGPGQRIEEMVQLQEEFKVFSSNHKLEFSFRLLGIVPCDQFERNRWFDFLGRLATYPSDVPKLNGAQRVIAAFEQTLTFVKGGTPPLHVTTHSMKEDPRVTFALQGQPLIFTTQFYRILSIPTKPAKEVKQEAAQAARDRRAKKAKKK